LYEYCLEEKKYAKLITTEIQKEIQKISNQSTPFFISQKLYEALEFTDSYYSYLLEKINIAESNKSTMIALLFYSNDSAKYQNVLKNNDYIYFYYTYVSYKDIDPSIASLEESKLKQFILSII